MRQDTAQAVEDFPAGEFDFKATPDLMTFGELARHILDAGHGLTGMLLDGVDNLATPQFREMIGKYRPQLPEKLDAATLASELRKSVETRNRGAGRQGRGLLLRHHHPVRRAARNPSRNAAVRQGARADAPGANVRILAVERDRSGHDAPPASRAKERLNFALGIHSQVSYNLGWGENLYGALP